MRWLLSRGRWPYLIVVGVLTAWLGWHAARLGIEQDNASLNTQDAEQLRVYAEFKASFGNDADLVLSVTHPELLGPGGLTLIDRLTRRIAALDGVRSVQSLTTAQQLVRGPAGAEPAPLIAPPFDAPDVGRRAAAALDRNPDFTGLLVAADRQTAGLFVEIEDRAADTEYRARLIDGLRALIAEHTGGPAVLHLTGVSVQKHDVSAYIARDQRVLLPLAVAVLGVILAGFFRSVGGVALPLAVNGITVLWTLGVYRLGGFALNAITALLPPLLLVLALAVSIHVYQAWLAGEGAPHDRTGRILHAVRTVRFPAFLCALTTAQGFLSLAASDMPAVRQFGVFGALGVLISFAVGLTFIPVVLSFLPHPPPLEAAPRHRRMLGVLQATAHLSTRHPWPVVGFFMAVSIVAAAAIPLVRSNTDLVRFLKANAPLYRDTMAIDARLTGALAFEFVVERSDRGALTTLDAVRRLAAFEAAARRPPQVTAVTSVLAVLRQLQRAEAGADRLALPDTEDAVAYAFDLLEAAEDRRVLRRLITGDFTHARVSVRVHAVGSAVSGPLIDALLAEGRRLFGADYTLRATGAVYHVVRDSERLVAQQVQSFGLAIVLVVLAIGVLLRSVAFTVIALIPNVMPIVWTGGLMGVLGIDLSTGTAMIAAAVLGLAVDDTIHYLVHYRRAYRGDCIDAIVRTTTGVGAPVTITSVVLICGFWIGGFGSFKPTIYFSLLTGVTMLTGVACDLLVLPACLVLFDRVRRAR
jgi:hypothetical protein